jgi:hypothetical protein
LLILGLLLHPSNAVTSLDDYESHAMDALPTLRMKKTLPAGEPTGNGGILSFSIIYADLY